MLRGLSLWLTLIITVLSSSGARAESPDDIPNPLRTRRSWVADEANVISPNVEDQLNQLIESEKKRTGCEIAVVSVRSLNGRSVENFATTLFNQWGIGQRTKNNGVLLLAAIEDRRFRIEVGRGIENTLTDAIASEIIRTAIVPRFRQGLYSQGLLEGTKATIRQLDDAELVRTSRNRSHVWASQADAPEAFRPRWTNGNRTGQIPPNRSIPLYSSSASSGGSNTDAFLIFGGIFLSSFILAVIISGLVRWARDTPCPKCGKPLRRLPVSQDVNYLSKVQQLERQLGSRNWEVWRCQICSIITKKENNVHWKGFSFCPKCHNRTLLRREREIKAATQAQEGTVEVNSTCQWHLCGHHETTELTLPRLPAPSPALIAHHSSSQFDSSSSSNSSFAASSSFSSSSGDFGGGSSDGGGASSSW